MNLYAIEAIHVHYRCNRCGSRIIEEFKRTDVFMDRPSAS